MEEAGYRAGQLVGVSSYHTSKRVCVETAHLYIGRDLMVEAALPDDTEFFEHANMPFDEVLQLVIESEIRDTPTA